MLGIGLSQFEYDNIGGDGDEEFNFQRIFRLSQEID